MSDLYKRIKNDLTVGMKDRNDFLVATLRFLISEIKRLEIDKYTPASPGELSDEDVTSVLQKSIKQHKESIEMFEKGGRQDLVDKERKELRVVSSYLPKQISKEEIRKVVEEVVSKAGKDNFGKVMGLVMGQVKGKADGQMVSDIVKELLSK